jgi:acyl-CoA thioesterase
MDAAKTPFGQQTTVEPVAVAPGRYAAVVTDDWNAPVIPQGGIITSLALRAMAAEIADSGESLRSVSTVFAAQVVPGPVEIDVTVLRQGRSMSQATATVRSAGAAAGHTSIAVFGRERPGFSFTELTMPEVPDPLDCPSFRDDAPDDFDRRFAPSFWEQVEGRPAIGHAPWDDYEPTTSEKAYWYRFEQWPRLDDGCIDPLALVTLCDTMPGAVGERIGPVPEVWFGPSADLTVHLLGEARSEWLLGHNQARFAGEGYASVEMALWDPDPAIGLVAYGTQMMFFSFPDGPPASL